MQDCIYEFSNIVLLFQKLEFIIREDITPTTPTVRMTLERIKDNLQDLVEKKEVRNEKIFDWIEVHNIVYSADRIINVYVVIKGIKLK